MQALISVEGLEREVLVGRQNRANGVYKPKRKGPCRGTGQVNINKRAVILIPLHYLLMRRSPTRIERDPPWTRRNARKKGKRKVLP